MDIYSIRTYLKTLNITLSELKQISTKQIDKKVKEWDTEQWRMDIRDKETLQIYKKTKET